MQRISTEDFLNAAKSGKIETVEQYLAQQREDIISASRLAIAGGHTIIVSKLATAGALLPTQSTFKPAPAVTSPAESKEGLMGELSVQCLQSSKNTLDPNLEEKIYISLRTPVITGEPFWQKLGKSLKASMEQFPWNLNDYFQNGYFNTDCYFQTLAGQPCYYTLRKLAQAMIDTNEEELKKTGAELMTVCDRPIPAEGNTKYFKISK